MRQAVDQALATGDIAQAADLAERALAAGPPDPVLLNLVAWRHEEAGDYAGAHRRLGQALALAPGDAMILGAIGAVLRKEGRHDEALAVLDHALGAQPHHPAGWLERGYVLDALRREADAEASYRRAIAIDPGLAPAFGRLADAAARRGDAAAARALAGQALALQPNEPGAVFALATLAIEVRDGTAAEQVLTGLLATDPRRDDRTRALTLMGDALDRQDRTGAAFAHYTAAQANFRAVHADVLAPTAERPSHRAFIARIAEQVVAGATEGPTSAPGIEGAAASHVFLMGYPRSGTTLVENILASAPGVIALEERDTLADTDDVLLGNDGTMHGLDTLDADRRIAAFRAAYWQRVTRYAGDVSGGMFVDMNPLGGIKLPIIARLFPQARILLMRRDPRDIVLSCFRINFAPSPAAWAMSDLAEAAGHYAALMHLTELCRERLPLAFHEVRYDQLVTDFGQTVREMAAFIGLEWTEAFRRFDRTAKTRGVGTASATQVRRGLYDGRGQWRRYAQELAPALPILAPWIERFGFDA